MGKTARAKKEKALVENMFSDNGSNTEVSDYYDIVRGSLKTIAQVIAEGEGSFALDNSLFFGRSGSTVFEDSFLKPLIRKYEDKFADRINSAFPHNAFRFVRIDTPLVENESLARSVADVSVFIQRPSGEITEEYVNIKATAGNSADNVGSWESLDRVLYRHSEKTAKRRNDLLNKISNEPINDNLGDYFLWVFNKNEPTVEKMMASSATQSMLGSSLKAFRVNMSQNYPIQFNSSVAEEVSFGDNFDIKDAKKALLEKILQAGIKFHQDQIAAWSLALESL